MDPKTFYGGEISGYESEDSVLASDSDEEMQTLGNSHEQLVIPIVMNLMIMIKVTGAMTIKLMRIIAVGLLQMKHGIGRTTQ